MAINNNLFKSFSRLFSTQALSPNLKKFIEAERYLNGGSRTYSPVSSYSELDEKFRPQSLVPSFPVPRVELPKEKVKIHISNPDQNLLNTYVNGVTASFFIHPQFYKNREVPYMDLISSFPQNGSVEVAPTASSRSTLVVDQKLPPHCIKLHCPVKISRFNRKLDGRDVSKGVRTSSEFDEIIKDKNCPSSFAFLPESLGVTIGEEHSWGYFVREMTPRPAPVDKESTLYPLFSLYSYDLREPGKKPLLVDLLEKSPSALLDKIMLPVIQNWCFLAREFGFLFQAHGQNLLLEVNSNQEPTRIVFRDLSTYMDRNLREKKGLSNEGYPLPDKSTRELSQDQQKGYYSLVYDSFLGHHLFEYLAQEAQKQFGINPEMLREACRAKFAECFPEAADFFPKTVHYYSSACADGRTQLVEDTLKKPDWR